MKINNLIPILSILFLVSCSKNEMKISRADKTIVSELIEQSPIYITKSENGSSEINENNRIGNTDWVFSVESSLPIASVLPEVQRLKEKKYAEGMHPDSKKIYFIYLDTVSNKPAYLPIDGFDFVMNQTSTESDLKFQKEITVEKFIQEMLKVTTSDTLTQKAKIFVY